MCSKFYYKITICYFIPYYLGFSENVNFEVDKNVIGLYTVYPKYSKKVRESEHINIFFVN